MKEPEPWNPRDPSKEDFLSLGELNETERSILERVKVVPDTRALLNDLETGVVPIRDFAVLWPLSSDRYELLHLAREGKLGDPLNETNLFRIGDKSDVKLIGVEDENGNVIVKKFPEVLGDKQYFLQPVFVGTGELMINDPRYLLPLVNPRLEVDIDLSFNHPPPEDPNGGPYNLLDSFLKNIKTGDAQAILAKIRTGELAYHDFLVWFNEYKWFMPLHLIREAGDSSKDLTESKYYEIHRFPSGEYEIFPYNLYQLLARSYADYELMPDVRLYPVETKEREPRQQPRAFITGVAGQDGSYLAEFLLSLGYEVYGCDLKGPHSENIAHLKDKMHWVDVDLTDIYSIRRALRNCQPDEIYHLAAFTHVGESFDLTNLEEVHDIWMTNFQLMTAIQLTAQETEKQIRYFFPGTAELFGNEKPPQDENTPYSPESPYAQAKAQAMFFVEFYGKKYSMFAPQVILFNHGSERRPEKFAERKISMAVAKVYYGLLEKEKFGNIQTIRDWGYAAEYVQVIHKILQQVQAGRYVIGTGEGHTVEELIAYAFSLIGKDWRNHVEIDQSLFRPREVNALIADITKARRELGWKPQVRAKELIKLMVQSDLEQVGSSLGREIPSLG